MMRHRVLECGLFGKVGDEAGAAPGRAFNECGMTRFVLGEDPSVSWCERWLRAWNDA